MEALARLRLALVIIAVVVMQNTLVAQVTVWGVHPDLMVALVVAAAITRGPAGGALIGFVAGIATDLLVYTPFGLSALTDVFIGYGVGMVSSEAVDNAWWIPFVVGALAGGAAEFLFALLGAMVGQVGMLQVGLGRAVPLEAVMTGVLVYLARAALSWASPSGKDDITVKPWM